jgi:hypothetical protein
MANPPHVLSEIIEGILEIVARTGKILENNNSFGQKQSP